LLIASITVSKDSTQTATSTALRQLSTGTIQ